MAQRACKGACVLACARVALWLSCDSGVAHCGVFLLLHELIGVFHFGFFFLGGGLFTGVAARCLRS